MNNVFTLLSLLSRVHFTPQIPADSANAAENGEDSPPIPPRLSFELRGSTSSRFRFKKLSTGGDDDDDGGQVSLMAGDATPPKRGGCCGKTNPSFVRALFRTFLKSFLGVGVLKVGHDLLLFVGPQLLR